MEIPGLTFPLYGPFVAFACFSLRSTVLTCNPSSILKPFHFLEAWRLTGRLTFFTSGMFHKVWTYVVLNILRMQNQSKRRRCENCDAWNRFVFPSENAGKPQTPTAVRILVRLAKFAQSRVSEIYSSSKQVSQVRRMFEDKDGPHAE